MPAKPVAEITVLPMPRDSAAEENVVMTTSRVEAVARALVWPQMCCCCGSTTTGLDSLGIHSKTMLATHARYAEQVAAVNPGGYLTTLYLD